MERIVAAALALVDSEGAGALSMRTLAQRLDTGTAVLYRAVANRSELVSLIVDQVFSEVVFDNASTRTDWQEACRSAAQRLFDTLNNHRGIAPLLIEQVPVGPSVMAHREQLLAMLLANGFSPEDAARTYATLARFVVGFAAQLQGHDTTANQDTAQLDKLFHQLDPEDFPATIATADCLPTMTLEKEFSFGLDLLIAGLTARHHSAVGNTKERR
ncbi:TetR/AcrR family transcriptional regulator [Nocardia sp. MDA0666]|uniref:TetR/AcrR family transcriptional regulator n=1 Tax=Nocardia sp. MDA0666 TaxID=2135448 RepID=UPI001E44ACDE|nr:TetR/AcrR family transcriptional regulator C-terminal domain-containing protein [Nocardia sp. MDA0666]